MLFYFLSEALSQYLNLLSQKLWVLRGRAVWGCFGLFLRPLGAAHGGVLGPLRTGNLHHAVSFPLRGFITKFEPSISKTLELRGRAVWGCFGLFLRPLGLAHRVVLVPLRTGSLHHALSFPLLGFLTKFEPSISKTLGFTRYGCLGLFWAVFGTLRGGTWRCPRSLTHGQPPPCCFISSQRL